MIRAALFDFGGVILSSPFEAFTRFEDANGLPDGFLRSVNATNPDTNAWASLERAEIGVAEFAARYRVESRELGHEVDGGVVLQLLMGEVRPAMVEALRRCHEHLKTGLLTNNFATAEDDGVDEATMTAEAPSSLPFPDVLQHFDVVIESRTTGVRKPDPRFYELACSRLEIEPSEAVFLDDLGVNLKSARAMGMTTIKVGDPAVAIDELQAVVGFPLR